MSLGGGAAVRRLLQFDAEGEDLLVTEARAALTRVLSPGWLLGAHAAFYDVGQRADSLEDARDFRSLAPGARLIAPLGPGRLALGAGWRWFVFKPAPSLDFHGPTLSLGYRRNPVFTLDGEAEWDYGFGTALEQRRFPLQPCRGRRRACGGATALARRDHFLSFDADVTRTADELLGAGISVQNNRSDRFGESLWRFAGHLRVVWLLPLDLSLAARAELVVTRYQDAVAGRARQRQRRVRHHRRRGPQQPARRPVPPAGRRARRPACATRCTRRRRARGRSDSRASWACCTWRWPGR